MSFLRRQNFDDRMVPKVLVDLLYAVLDLASYGQTDYDEEKVLNQIHRYVGNSLS